MTTTTNSHQKYVQSLKKKIEERDEQINLNLDEIQSLRDKLKLSIKVNKQLRKQIRLSTIGDKGN